MVSEIYNYRSLRWELEAKRHAFRTTSDTAVTIHLYEEWGPDCGRLPRGMFASIVGNSRQRTLTLARFPTAWGHRDPWRSGRMVNNVLASRSPEFGRL